MKQLSKTADGITIAVLVFLLAWSCIAIFWEAQTIAKQQAVIHEMLERNRP